MMDFLIVLLLLARPDLVAWDICVPGVGCR
jgi:hypothetical protein